MVWFLHLQPIAQRVRSVGHNGRVFTAQETWGQGHRKPMNTRVPQGSLLLRFWLRQTTTIPAVFPVPTDHQKSAFDLGFRLASTSQDQRVWRATPPARSSTNTRNLCSCLRRIFFSPKSVAGARGRKVVVCSSHGTESRRTACRGRAATRWRS
jgi:hypothetical protein